MNKECLIKIWQNKTTQKKMTWNCIFFHSFKSDNLIFQMHTRVNKKTVVLGAIKIRT